MTKVKIWFSEGLFSLQDMHDMTFSKFVDTIRESKKDNMLRFYSPKTELECLYFIDKILFIEEIKE